MKSIAMFSLALALASGCEDGVTSYAGNDLGIFAYTAYDTLGNAHDRGAIVLYQDGSRVTGFWRFEDGRSGDLEGSIQGDHLDINLNPGFVDNNLLLSGTLSGGMYLGVWQQIGFPGIMDRGSFEAMKH